MKLFIVVSGGAPFPSGTIVREFDQGFSKITKDGQGNITGCEELVISHLSLMPFILPFNLKGQWDLWQGEAYHKAAKSGSAAEARFDALLNPKPVVGDEFDDPEEYM